MESPSASNRSAELFSYRLDLAYVGTPFQGWQSQPHRLTVQDHLQSALRTCMREDVVVMGASRTDTGVHAEHQVASFRSAKVIDCARVRRSLQALLPPTIGIYSLEPCARDFHPIVDAQAKLYRYRIWRGSTPSPFARPYVWTVPKGMDATLLETAGRQLLGYQNFQSFCASDSNVESFERTLYDVRCLEHGPLCEFYVLGDGFLKQMVRSIVGTLVEIAQGKRASHEIRRILDAKDRTMAGKTAPAQGLSLVRIFYHSQTTIPEALLSDPRLLSFTLGPDLER